VFVTKNFDATPFSELVRKWPQFGQFCIDLRVVMKRVRNAPKLEFWIEWSGSGVFAAKNTKATWFSKFVR
jgi:hypothetical protein